MSNRVCDVTKDPSKKRLDNPYDHIHSGNPPSAHTLTNHPLYIEAQNSLYNEAHHFPDTQNSEDDKAAQTRRKNAESQRQYRVRKKEQEMALQAQSMCFPSTLSIRGTHFTRQHSEGKAPAIAG
ncbi:hypothetical protein M408DRAFT_59498 [Serendipita vermifera MAFF 305830]|uniref:BZIP domain-containing protein n=1 Tax=Serendipita vermifera MAFF 305830 TaxID=933852 RepID=A0A0C3BAZ5_SERVB|nr:hypothetical protein M408DRAFT_59498 [Serendipita vermifera MAFF 305830]